jgi:hypothetical protein
MLSYAAVRRAALWIVALHAVVSSLHGIAHLLIPVPIGMTELVYILLVIAVAPILGVWLMRPPYYRTGARLLLAGMAGALVFGLAEHFVLPGGDNVAQVPAGAWLGTFQWTSVGLLITEAIGTLVGLAALKAQFVVGERK